MSAFNFEEIQHLFSEKFNKDILPSKQANIVAELEKKLRQLKLLSEEIEALHKEHTTIDVNEQSIVQKMVSGVPLDEVEARNYLENKLKKGRFDKIEMLTQAFYELAWNCISLLEQLPGFNHFRRKISGIVKVRNHLIAHAKDPSHIGDGFALMSATGPVLKGAFIHEDHNKWALFTHIEEFLQGIKRILEKS